MRRLIELSDTVYRSVEELANRQGLTIKQVRSLEQSYEGQSSGTTAYTSLERSTTDAWQ